MGNPKRILLVCGGNTCRSPMAKVILEQMFKSEGLNAQFKVDSAACRGPDGTTAHPNAHQAIKEKYGADLLANHIPKKMTTAMVNEADLIIVMEDYMKASLPASKVIVLGISDPYGSGPPGYKACAAEIEQGFQKNWSNIVNIVPSPQKTESQPLSTSPQLNMTELMKKYGIKPQVTADWVYNEVLKIAEKVNYGRGKHSETVTRLMLNMYDDLTAIGLISHNADKRKLAKITGLSHDIGVGKEQGNEGHNAAGWRMLKEHLWKDEGLAAYRKDLLAVVIYGVFYHRDKIPDGKLKPMGDIPLEDYRTTAELVSILRIADGLDYGLVKGSPDKIGKVEMVRTSKTVECRVSPRPGEDVMMLVAKSYSKREVFEATFGKLTFWLPGEGNSWRLWNP